MSIKVSMPSPANFGLFIVLLMTLASISGYFLLKGDIIETLYFGRDFQLFYPKHPPVTFWFAGALLHFFPSDILLAVCTVILYLGYAVICYMGWVFAKQYFDDQRSQVLIVFSIALALFSKHIYFTPDLMAIVLSSMMLWFFYLAIKHDKFSDWALFILCALLFFFSKYQAVVSFIALGCTMLMTQEGRARFKSFYFWQAVIFGAAILIPYCVYIILQDSSSVSYAKDTATKFGDFSLTKGLVTPLSVAFLPILLALIFFSKNKIKEGGATFKVELKKWSFDTAFIVVNSFGFLFFWGVFCFIFDHKLQTRFTIQNIIPFTLLFFSVFAPSIRAITERSLKITLIIFISLIGLMFIGKVYKQNSWNKYALHQQAYTQIQQSINQSIDYIVVGNRDYDRFYLSFDEKPYMRITKYVDEAALYDELHGKTVLLLWREKEVPEWVHRFKSAYPQLKQGEPILLSLNNATLLGVIPAKKASFSVNYAFIKADN